ncbi:sirohydrochlorin chelatase [Synechococcus sp. H70.2]|uniref:sirohydrochlorin chelatase n=1 Tax=Synechococcus sp. H70.2 TaxID=2964528 RepID=UPI0039C26C08
MSSTPLVFLVCHGSRDPEYQQAAADLLARVRQRLAPQAVELVQLESGSLSLGEQIHSHLAAQRPRLASPVVLVSLFMGGGSHVEEDLPAALEELRARWPRLKLLLTPPIGQHPALLDLLAARMVAAQHLGDPVHGWILFGHGSRLPSFAAQLEAGIRVLEQRLPGILIHPAFAAQPPTLEATVIRCLRLSQYRLRVLPFFLFPGSLLRSLQDQVRQLRRQWPLLQLEVEPPLWRDPQLMQAIVETVQMACPS